MYIAAIVAEADVRAAKQAGAEREGIGGEGLDREVAGLSRNLRQVDAELLQHLALHLGDPHAQHHLLLAGDGDAGEHLLFVADELGGEIEGEAGLGKSRLVAETEWIAQEAGVHVLMGEADSIEQSTPYLAWRMVFASILGYDPRSEKTWDIAALTRLTDDPFILDNSPLLNVVLPHACLLKRQPIEIASV